MRATDFTSGVQPVSLPTIHASLHNHFSHERHLIDRQTYKTRRSAALAEWQSLMA